MDVVDDEVDESRACHVDPSEQRVVGELGGKQLRYLARIAATALGEKHGDIRAEVAVGFVFRCLYLVVDSIGVGQHAGLSQAVQAS
ncbi:MAG TPA: hypothetical protein VLD39_14415, partial [Gammaproteobacteria bacterium]|nr:hypothetical protein [Gammaproteobacteria bacterium]